VEPVDVHGRYQDGRRQAQDHLQSTSHLGR
jgi:hypothetical protein